MTNKHSSTATADPVSDTGMEQEHPLAEAGQEAGQTAGHLAERAADVGFKQADRTREQAAEGIDSLASSVRRLSTDMESEQPAIANIASTAAEQAERVAGYLRQTDARELVSNVEDIARRQPLLFVGGAFLLGLAASRFVKAAGGGSSGSQGQYGSASYAGSTYGPTYGQVGNRGIGGYDATGPGAIGTDRLNDPIDETLRP